MFYQFQAQVEEREDSSDPSDDEVVMMNLIRAPLEQGTWKAWKKVTLDTKILEDRG